ncbi:hypothetical protein CF640_36355, partial [Burkholderia pseudomallei]
MAIAAIVAPVLWSRALDYGVLYSNLSDRDCVAIIAALQQAKVPYKFADCGGAILVLSIRVQDTLLKRASMALPLRVPVGGQGWAQETFGRRQSTR